MRISETGLMTSPANLTFRARAAERGLTLVELLVGLAIAGLAAGAVILTLPASPDTLEREGVRLAAKLRAASDLAILSGQSIGVSITPAGYRFHRMEGGTWRAFGSGSPLTPADWPDAVRAELETGGMLVAEAAGEENQPDLRFEPVAMATPFTLRLLGWGERFAITGDGAGHIRLMRGEDG